MVTSVGERPLFRVGDAVFTWADVVERTRETGEWAELEREVRAGLAAVREAPPVEDDVDAAARAFRYVRGLLAGDELDAWLEARGLSADAWQDYLRRILAREAAPEAEGDEDPARYVWAEGICSGVLEAAAHELASLVAVAPEAPPEPRDEEYEAFWNAAATDAAIAREVEANRLVWVRVRYDAVTVPDEDAAGEVAMCVRSDGEPLAEVAARVGAVLDEREDWLDEIEPELATRFAAAETGTVVGPVPVETGFAVALLHARTPPTVDDEDVRERAAYAVASRAVTRATDERVTWLEHV
jgi:hypothetical protein